MKKISNKKINIKYNYYKKYKDVKEIIEKRYNILIGIIIIIVFVLFTYLFYVQIIRNEYYIKRVELLSINTYEGSTAPRGRIYDRNHKIIVDNEPVKVIYYEKQSSTTVKREIELAYTIADMIEVDFTKLTDNMKLEFWVRSNPSLARDKITEEEWRLLEERKLTLDDIESLEKERVTEDELNEYKDIDKESVYIYYLMNKGFSYSKKIIKNSNVSDLEYALVASKVSELDGFNIRLDWNRSYPYGNALKTILGSVSTYETGIPSDLKEYYLDKGYNLDDRVGISYIEYQYDDYLKGTKNVYQKLNNGDDILVSTGTRGNDIVLTIDIELQAEIEKIMEEELLKAKKEPNTKYYDKSFVVVTEPKTGDILAMVGKQIKEKDGKYVFYDYTPGVLTAPITVGSAIKGASQIVGYNTGALKIGEKRYDNCVKLASTPIKCSWKPLGNLNDLTALKYSSNTFQFYTAMKVAGYNYVYNGGFKLKNDAFKIYRDTFNEFGLGVKTGIDLPVESTGVHGKNDTPGLLLDFSIGQYDTYTALQLSQYIGTIANDGDRMELHLLDKVYSSDSNLEEEIYSYQSKLLNKVDTKTKYMSRIKEGFKLVLNGGTGYGYINTKYKPAGKTGTSQSFIDSDLDGKIDKETLTHTFVAYAPYDNPQVTFTIVSPDVYYATNSSTYTTGVNKRITKKISEKYFNLYNSK